MPYVGCGDHGLVFFFFFFSFSFFLCRRSTDDVVRVAPTGDGHATHTPPCFVEKKVNQVNIPEPGKGVSIRRGSREESSSGGGQTPSDETRKRKPADFERVGGPFRESLIILFCLMIKNEHKHRPVPKRGSGLPQGRTFPFRKGGAARSFRSALRRIGRWIVFSLIRDEGQEGQKSASCFAKRLNGLDRRVKIEGRPNVPERFRS